MDLRESSDEDVVLIGYDDVSNFNEDNILPEAPGTIAKIKSWLEPTDYDGESSEYRKHLASHLNGTGKWLFNTDGYAKWHENSDHGLLWIRGIPGSGKSVFAATLAHRLAEESVPLLFFFFRQIIDANHQPVNLLRDWLAQLLPYSPPLQQILNRIVQSKRAISTLSVEEFWGHLRLALSYLPRVYCIIDALDEMDHGNDDFIQALAQLGHWRPSNVKVLMTSRLVLSVEQPMQRFRVVHIRLDGHLVDVDIAAYVEHKLSESQLSLHNRALVKAAVPGRANGLFLYAKLAVRALLEPGADISEVLSRLPSDLSTLYAGLLEEHARRSGVAAATQRLILQWITHATRPLRMLELADIVRTVAEPDKADQKMGMKHYKSLIRLACGPLLEIRLDETVCVVHHSLTEFLVGSTGSNASQLGFVSLEGKATHRDLAVACLTYMRSVWPMQTEASARPDFSNGYYQLDPGLSLQFPFIQYAARNWHIHVAKSVGTASPSVALLHNVRGFFESKHRRLQWLRFCWPMRRGDFDYDAISNLQIAVFCGMKAWVSSLLDSNDTVQVNAPGNRERTALWWAADRGHVDIVELLLAHGADPKLVDVQAMSPLHRAAMGNHHIVVEILLRAGAAPNPKFTGRAESRQTWKPPLMYACGYGHLKTVETFIPLLDSQAKQEALCWAARGGQSKLVKRLLQEPHIDPSCKVDDVTALLCASKAQSIETMKLLVDAKADASTLCTNYDPYSPWEARQRAVPSSNRGYTALHAFCEAAGRNRGRTALDPGELLDGFSYLMLAGADIRQKDLTNAEPLHLVRSVEMAKILLHAGADPNAELDNAMTMLHKCININHSALMHLLLAEGADINRRERGSGHTPLLLAITTSLDCAFQLLQYRPDVSLSDYNGDGPLHLAIRNLWHQSSRLDDILEALVSAGAEANSRNGAGESPLHVMASKRMRFEEGFDVLLAHGADVNARDSRGRTVLFRMLQPAMTDEMFFHNVERLRAASALLDVTDARGRGLLHHAIAASVSDDMNYRRTLDIRPLTIFQYFINAGLNPLITDLQGNTLFHEVALLYKSSNGDPAVWIGLLDHISAAGVDASQPNDAGTTPLHIVCQCTTPLYARSAAQFIDAILRGTDVNKPDSKCFRPLHFAASISQHMVQRLMEAGADPSALTESGMNALHIAAKCRQSNIVGMILEYVARKSAPNSEAIINQQDRYAYTPLHYACVSGRSESVQLLLAAAADPNPSDLRVKDDLGDGTWLPPILQCLSFAAEHHQWRSTTERHSTVYYALPAGAVKLGDEPRRQDDLDTVRQSYRREPDRFFTAVGIDVNFDTARVEEIIQLLISHGADPYQSALGDLRNTFFKALEKTGKENSDYITETMWRLLDQTRGDRPLPDMTGAVRMSRARRQAEREAFLSPSPVTSGGAVHLELSEHVVKTRQYSLMRAMYEAGADFTVSPPGRGMSPLQMLARCGFADLTNICCTPEEACRFDCEVWCAKTEQVAVRDDPHDVLIQPPLIGACERKLPNLDVLRVLVEEKGVDVNAQELTFPHKRNTDQTPKRGRAALHILADGGSWWRSAQGIPYLVSKGADVDRRDAGKRTPLHCALDFPSVGEKTFRYQTVRVLLELGADVNATTGEGLTCLDHAGDSAELVSLLISHGATVTVEALIAAVDAENVEAVESLLSGRFDPNVAQAEKRSCHPHGPVKHPLIAASWPEAHMTYRQSCDKSLKAREAIMRLLIQKGADPYDKFLVNRPPPTGRLRFSFEPNREASHAWLLNPGQYLPGTAFQQVSDSEPAPKPEEQTSLHYILANCCVFKPLLEIPDLDIDYRDSFGRTPLLSACRGPGNGRYGMPDAVLVPLDMLLTRHADPLVVDLDGRNALHHLLGCNTVVKDKLACLKRFGKALLTLINQADHLGYYPLHYGVASMMRPGQDGLGEEWVQYVVQQGCDPAVPDSSGNTVLHYLARGFQDNEMPFAKCTPALIHMFLQLGLDINARNNDGRTPLFLYCHGKRVGLSTKVAGELFDEVGADWTVRDNEGRTLLHEVLNHDPTAFEFVMEKGADAMAEDAEGRTSLDLAAAYGHKNIIQMFEAKQDQWRYRQ